ncbi:hypothetical protein SAMD00019534_041400 [Acytostelium subglobosum LB1]|uniref:hypothetical protein n=1 Tax=Acytostelium subglobosum LB1 TaxID=1410327 RepID=UPI000644A0C0|nr:hypothetical protein SAMD00019534_041400 [Acytostelium subglobosum LB1]GAM20965.1 hypothetical protein SAMD00019534_041400 [Acytostelium subglobosum LB1]|eukprot:XP_012756099.1 hypothetical protein SAMD00019534_041400 [Acytostelium subglobosum LB1]
MSDNIALSLDQFITNKKAERKKKAAPPAAPKAALSKNKLAKTKSKAKPVKTPAKPVKQTNTSAKTTTTTTKNNGRDEASSSKDSSSTVPNLKITIENTTAKPKAAATKLIGKVHPKELKITTENDFYKPSLTLPTRPVSSLRDGRAPLRGSSLLSRLRTRRDDLDMSPIRTTTRYDRDDYIDDRYEQDDDIMDDNIVDDDDYRYSSGRGGGRGSGSGRGSTIIGGGGSPIRVGSGLRGIRGSGIRGRQTLSLRSSGGGMPRGHMSSHRDDYVDEEGHSSLLRSRNPHHDINRIRTGTHETGRNLKLFTGTRLRVYNLHFNISEDDLKAIFVRAGEIKSVRINFDNSGRSNGTAYVIFYNKGDADIAVKTFNNAQLDGKMLKVEYDNDNRDM